MFWSFSLRTKSRAHCHSRICLLEELREISRKFCCLAYSAQGCFLDFGWHSAICWRTFLGILNLLPWMLTIWFLIAHWTNLPISKDCNQLFSVSFHSVMLVDQGELSLRIEAVLFDVENTLVESPKMYFTGFLFHAYTHSWEKGESFS